MSADQAGMMDLAHGEIDADEGRGRSEVYPSGGLLARLLQQSQAHLDDQPAVLGEVDEPIRGEHPKFGMMPTGQCLETSDRAVCEPDDRLVHAGRTRHARARPASRPRACIGRPLGRCDRRRRWSSAPCRRP